MNVGEPRRGLCRACELECAQRTRERVLVQLDGTVLGVHGGQREEYLELEGVGVVILRGVEATALQKQLSTVTFNVVLKRRNSYKFRIMNNNERSISNLRVLRSSF